MSKLRLSVAMGDYDRTRPLADGGVPIDGVDPVFLSPTHEEIFFRAFRNEEFDICELSLSSFVIKVSNGDCPYVGIPAFPSRTFRHTSIYIRTDRGIRSAADLAGRRIGVPEYQLTAIVWARALLDELFGVKPSAVRWVRGGMEQASRAEKIKINLPPDIRLEDIPENATLNAMFEAGEIDALIAPRPPSCYRNKHPHVGLLFPDMTGPATEYYEKTRVFPIMHLIGVRRSLVGAHPWLPAVVLKAFEQAKTVAVARLEDFAALKVTLPFIEAHLKETRKLMGRDFWAYGIEPNRVTLENFLLHHHAQGLSQRLVQVSELFHPTTYESAKL